MSEASKEGPPSETSKDGPPSETSKEGPQSEDIESAEESEKTQTTSDAESIGDFAKDVRGRSLILNKKKTLLLYCTYYVF